MNPNESKTESTPQAPASDTSPPEGQWSTGICGCFDDVTSCCVTCWCPCITFGRTAEIVDKGKISCFTAARNCFMLAYVFGIGACIYTCTYRAKLRAHYSLPPKPCGDCCVHYFCFYCALCQEHRELKNRGLDPEGGWVAAEANAKKLRGRTTAPPVPSPGMTR
ncbi:protein PLANT CADMIUM RESISTANCE 7-like [Quercus robur]|uniref:protein PLANT CADMIUM RESISTANCE 7-like n=1 Tax=Quercus robur TaxID=38942 RepID=UPI002163588F|nr:protein PLANT CADMIUM RESISTANCE 7-like [Quercus robur]